MGNLWTQNSICDNRNSTVELSNRKRKNEADLNDLENNMSPAIKRPMTTSKYIYNALFVNGENSDITISALEYQWKLHKVYLRQAGYFRGMFGGSWKESEMGIIELNIPDRNIDKEALNIAFGSLYSDEVVISPNKVISVLAAASLIHLEGLLQQCSEVMLNTICSKNVCSFYKTATVYGQTEVENRCIVWLENNVLLPHNSFPLLNDMDNDLMFRVINSPNLCVVQVEMDVYSWLKKWLYCKLVEPDLTGLQNSKVNAIATDYFKAQFKDTGRPVLALEEGEEYVKTFRSLRLCNIIRDFDCSCDIERDGIIPFEWIMPLYREQWLTMLRVEQGVDYGPDENINDFDENSIRCGRLLSRDTDYCWRWNGYKFAFDLLVNFYSKVPKVLSLKRNFHSQRRIASVGSSIHRRFLYNIRVFSLNEKGHVVNCFSTGTQALSLKKEEEKFVLTFDEENRLRFPLYVSATFQIVSRAGMGNNFDIAPVDYVRTVYTVKNTNTE